MKPEPSSIGPARDCREKFADYPAVFDATDGWQVFASGQARGELSLTTGPDGAPGLRLEYDFGDGSGFVVMRREVAMSLPEAFSVAFKLRGSGPPNHLEFKTADPTGANVWRHLRQDYALPAEWSAWQVTERTLTFAWGPAGGGAPHAVGAIEMAVVAGPGGRGWVELAGFSLLDESPGIPVALHASSQVPGHAAAMVFPPAGRGKLPPVPNPCWRAAPNDPAPFWEADLGRLQRFGGLVIDWPDELPPRAYQLEASADGALWHEVHRATAATGPRSYVSTPGASARHLRFRFANASCAAIRGLSLKPDAFSRTPNEFIHAIATDQPRGSHPRYWHREQSYWTPVGSPAGRRRGLLNEDGLLETDEAGFSLEPFLLLDGRLLTWAEVDASPTLPADGSPLPGVVWHLPGLRLHIEPWVDGSRDALTLRAVYRIECDGPVPENLRIAIAVRPFQVNPPWQAFRNLGGISPISKVSASGLRIHVNDRVVIANHTPAAIGVAAFEQGGVLPMLAQGMVPAQDTVEDPSGLASAAGIWTISPDQSLVLAVPFGAHEPAAAVTDRAPALTEWQQTLANLGWDVPDAAAPAVACFRTAAGHILINRDGPAIQPGPRRYTRSWVRDCVIMGAALAKAGLPHALQEFLVWYAPFQRADGFVPCVVDRDGIDWLVEHDSHGQLLWGLREWLRNAGNHEVIAPFHPSISLAAEYLITLRATRMTPAFETPERRTCYGLLPESASHEGYLAHPVHSYWDDFWGIRGLHAAADMAEALGHPDDAARWRIEAGHFLTDVRHSLDLVIARRGLDYLPGSVEWADFDPTATANAIALLDFADSLPPAPLRAMLATYLDGFRRKHSGAMPWTNYTAYEIRIIGAFVRLGMRDEAHELLERFLIDRRPAVWNQWPEITWRDARSPGHLGDVPHTWIAAEFLLAFASMVVAEREETDSLVLASGLSWQWICGERPFAVRGLPTRFGPVDFSIHAPSPDRIEVCLSGPANLPRGGITISPPLPAGRLLSAHSGADGRSVAVPSLPYTAVLMLERAPETPA